MEDNEEETGVKHNIQLILTVVGDATSVVGFYGFVYSTTETSSG